MKKRYLLLLASALLFSGCGNETLYGDGSQCFEKPMLGSIVGEPKVIVRQTGMEYSIDSYNTLVKSREGKEKACMERAGMVLKEFPRYEDIRETAGQGEYSFHVKKYDNEKTVYVYRTEAANMPGFNKENVAPIHIRPTDDGKYRTLIDDPLTKERIDVTDGGDLK